jgi:peptidoglycan/LPS O-acetylase OafA/YrhL
VTTTTPGVAAGQAPPETAAGPTATPGAAPPPARVVGLDGLRGLAALYVVLFHCWLYTFTGFPENPGPGWLGWLLYGRLAVVFFLMVSGFSLALSAAANGWQLGGLTRFLRRRAWRILPPYWAALAFSLVIAWVLDPAPGEGPPSHRTVVIYGALAQDLIAERTPNAAFWSIAIEAELYLLFPLLLLIRRRLGAVVLLAGVTLPVIVLGLQAPGRTPVEGLNGLMPHLAPVFVAGLVCAGVVTARERIRRWPWPRLAALAAAPVLLLIVAKGSVWTVEHYFWIDLAIAPAMALLLVAVATGRPAPLVRLLDTRPVRGLGGFSYSLYLTHVPIVMVIARLVAPVFVEDGLPAFWFTLVVGVPTTVVAARLFARYFELPFQRHRSWTSLMSAARSERS